MNKMSAVGMLVSGECDSILHGSSEFILQGEDVVNKRSKKALDMKKMLEEGWDTKMLPRWDDAMQDGAERPTLCVLENDGSLIIILSKTEDGEYITSYGEIYDRDTYGQLRPATRDEALALLADVKDAAPSKPKPKTKPKSEPKIKEEVPREEEPAVITGETDISETGETFAEMPQEELIDLCGVPEEENPFVEDQEYDDSCITGATEGSDVPKPQEECQPQRSTNTTKPKDGGEPTLKDQYVSLGLDKDLWPDFCSYCFTNDVDNVALMERGMKYASSCVIDFMADRSKGSRRDSTKHESDDTIIDKLEVLVDFGLESNDAIDFYEYHKLDKFRLATLISDATDGRLTELVTQFYDERK